MKFPRFNNALINALISSDFIECMAQFGVT